MAYADYEYYCNTYKGTMQQPDFERLCRRASAYLDMVTFGRVSHAPNSLAERIQNACCAVADAMYRQECGGVVVSASNDGYSETYATDTRNPDERLYAVVMQYLGITGLLYRGANI